MQSHLPREKCRAPAVTSPALHMAVLAGGQQGPCELRVRWPASCLSLPSIPLALFLFSWHRGRGKLSQRPTGALLSHQQPQFGL